MGNPLNEHNQVGSLISVAEAQRVEAAISNAVSQGAQLLIGGERDGAFVSPAILTNVDPSTSIAQDELFGPAVVVTDAESDRHAIELANSTAYGLGAGIFTRDVSKSIQAMREIDAGIIHVNWTPLWRADLMPYGGLKASGVGKEGVRTTAQEMTEEKTVIMHGSAW
jgi:glyceraldehyde-3-phosphate dehydrogenase (NADP+)